MWKLLLAVILGFGVTAFAGTPEEILKNKIPVIIGTCKIDQQYKLGEEMPIKRECAVFAEMVGEDVWVLVLNEKKEMGAIVKIHKGEQKIVWIWGTEL